MFKVFESATFSLPVDNYSEQSGQSGQLEQLDQLNAYHEYVLPE